MDYTNIESGFIRDRLRETSWENRRYIDELLRLREQLGRRASGRMGMYDAMGCDLRAKRYPAETKALLLELRDEKEITPELWAEIQEEVRREQEEGERAKQERAETEAVAAQREEQRIRQQWNQMGGRP
jgi:hypothetical protein